MKETLCWYCAIPGTGRCCWDKSLSPVPGWSAEPTFVDGFHTFRVDKCPLFVADRDSTGPLSGIL